MRVGPTLDKIAKIYGNRVRFVYKHFVVHPQRATTPALAACAAQHQRKFLPMYKLIFSKFGKFSQADMDNYARQLKLNMGKFHRDMQTCKSQIRREQADMTRLGTRGVPAFYINGRFLSGNRPLPQFKRLIDEELRKAQRSGISASSYYRRVVLGRGKSSL